MQTEVSSKYELSSLAGNLVDETKDLDDSLGKLKSMVSRVRDYDNIDVSTAGNILKNNIQTVMKDLDATAKNIRNYSRGIEKLDEDDFTTQADIFSLKNIGNSAMEFVVSDIPNYVNGKVENAKTNINNAIDGVETLIDSAATTVAGAIGLSSVIPENNPSITEKYPHVMLESEAVNTNPKTQKTRDSSHEITERTTVDNVIIQPGSTNPDTDLSVYHNNTEQGFQVTVGNLSYELNANDYETMCAVVQAESDGTYDDALAVTTTILNRCETSNWISAHSRNPIEQIKAPGQFEVYMTGSYESRLGNITDTVDKAVSDGLAGVRNHNYLFFRSNGSTSYSDIMITSTGNRYGYK